MFYSNLLEVCLVVLDMGVLVVGVKYWGEFEEWLKVVFKEVEDFDGKVIFFIDEIYFVFGVGEGCFWIFIIYCLWLCFICILYI